MDERSPSDRKGCSPRAAFQERNGHSPEEPPRIEHITGRLQAEEWPGAGKVISRVKFFSSLNRFAYAVTKESSGRPSD